jgi:hypothetical protein
MFVLFVHVLHSSKVLINGGGFMFKVLKKMSPWILLGMLFVFSAFAYCDGNDIMVGGVLADKNVVSEIPIKFVGYNMLVKVDINHSPKEYTFLLDTGSQVVIDKKVAQELNVTDVTEKSETKTRDAVGITQNGEIIQLKSLKVGDIEVQSCGARILDLSRLQSWGLKVDGILGDNFLRFLLVKIDYKKKVLTLTGNTDKFTPNRWFGFNFMRSNGNIFAQFTAGSVGSLMAEIDTGGAEEAIYFPYKFLEFLKSDLSCPSIKSIGPGVGGLFGETNVIYSRLSSMIFGQLKVTDVAVMFANGPENIVIPNSYLSHFIVTINYPQSQIVLEPNGKPIESNIKTFGFSTKKDNEGKIRIIGLLEATPAVKAGLKVGDEITDLQIDGQAMGFEDFKEKIMGDQDVSISFQVVNGSGKRKITLRKANLLPDLK